MEESGFYKEVGLRIRMARIKRGLTQEALASLVSLTRTSITNIEKGRQKVLLHTFVDLARALRTSCSSLLPRILGSSEVEFAKLLADEPAEVRSWINAALKSPRGRK